MFYAWNILYKGSICSYQCQLSFCRTCLALVWRSFGIWDIQYICKPHTQIILSQCSMYGISYLKARFVAINAGFYFAKHVWLFVRLPFGIWDLQYICKPHTEIIISQCSMHGMSCIKAWFGAINAGFHFTKHLQLPLGSFVHMRLTIYL